MGEVCSTAWNELAKVRMRSSVRRRSDARSARLLTRGRTGAFEGGFVGARENPGFVGNAGSEGAERDVVATDFHDAHVLLFFLRDNVAENATLLALVVVAAGAQFVEHAARNEGSSGDLRGGMGEFLPGALAVILKDADVFQAGIAFQILNAERGEMQELLDFGVAGIPDMAIVARIFDEDFVGSNRSHAIVEAFAAALGFALDVVESLRMNDGTGRPGVAIETGDGSNNLHGIGGGAAERANLRTRRGLGEIVADDHPRAGDGIFAKFHGGKKNKRIGNLQLVIVI